VAHGGLQACGRTLSILQVQNRHMTETRAEACDSCCMCQYAGPQCGAFTFCQQHEQMALAGRWRPSHSRRPGALLAGQGPADLQSSRTATS
jgi:hypothetical protein